MVPMPPLGPPTETGSISMTNRADSLGANSTFMRARRRRKKSGLFVVAGLLPCGDAVTVFAPTPAGRTPLTAFGDAASLYQFHTSCGWRYPLTLK
jgi:hypothetical protein